MVMEVQTVISFELFKFIAIGVQYFELFVSYQKLSVKDHGEMSSISLPLKQGGLIAIESSQLVENLLMNLQCLILLQLRLVSVYFTNFVGHFDFRSK